MSTGQRACLVGWTSIYRQSLLVQHAYIVYRPKSCILQALLSNDNVDVQVAGGCSQAAQQVHSCWGMREWAEGLLQQQEGRAGDHLGGHSYQLALPCSKRTCTKSSEFCCAVRQCL